MIIGKIKEYPKTQKLGDSILRILPDLIENYILII